MLIATRQLVRAIRGELSQKQLCRRLGYRSNPVADWEAGRRMPTAVELLRMCRVVGIDAEAAFLDFHYVAGATTSEGMDLASWLDSLRGPRTIATLSKDFGVSRFKVRRWLSGEVSPRASELLLFIEGVTGRLSELVGSLVPIERVPVLLPDHRAAQAAKRLAHEAPWTEAVLRVLECRDYVPGAIARQLGVDRDTEDESIRRLIEAKIVRREPPVRVKVTRPLNVDTQASVTLKAHWCDVARERVEDPLQADLFAYNVLSASETDIARIRRLLIETFSEVRAIVKNSSSVEAVALVNLQLVTFPSPDES